VELANLHIYATLLTELLILADYLNHFFLRVLMYAVHERLCRQCAIHICILLCITFTLYQWLNYFKVGDGTVEL